MKPVTVDYLKTKQLLDNLAEHVKWRTREAPPSQRSNTTDAGWEYICYTLANLAIAYELMAKRIDKLERLFNIIEGFSRKDDILTKRFLETTLKDRPTK